MPPHRSARPLRPTAPVPPPISGHWRLLYTSLLSRPAHNLTSEPAAPTASTSRFDGIRSAHRLERAEDYCEAVAELSRRTGEARVRDLAALMGVSHVTVSRMITRLTSMGLVAQRQGRPVVLTDAGRRLAADSEGRHAVVLNFLLALGISRDNAEVDAEGIEHHVCAETIAAMLAHTRLLQETAARAAAPRKRTAKSSAPAPRRKRGSA